MAFFHGRVGSPSNSRHELTTTTTTTTTTNSLHLFELTYEGDLMRVLAFLLPICMITATVSAQTVSVDFESAVEGLELSGDAEVRAEGGNPNGYLSVTDAANGQRGTIFVS